MVTARRTKRTAAGERWWTIDFSLREEDIQMTGITVSEGRVPGSSVGGQKRAVMWTDDKRHRGLGARSTRNLWTGKRVDLSGGVVV